YLGMGLTAENLVMKYNISRLQQDEFALWSHRKSIAALQEGKFKDETVPLQVPIDSLNSQGKKTTKIVQFEQDEGPREDTSLEALEKLKPAFHAEGTITAGNSS